MKRTRGTAIPIIDDNVYYCMERTKGIVFQSLMTMFIIAYNASKVPIIGTFDAQPLNLWTFDALEPLMFQSLMIMFIIAWNEPEV